MFPRLCAWVFILASAAMFPENPAFGQGRAGNPGNPPGTGASTGTNNGGTPTPSAGSTAGTVPNASQRPGTLFITGRVMLEDGTPPSNVATIERVCAGSTHAEGYTDSRGYFAVEVGNESTVFQDASETSGYGRLGSPRISAAGGGSSSSSGRGGAMSSDLRFANCDLRARLTGYRSQTVNLAGRRPLDDPNIGVILLHRQGKDEGNLVSMVSLAAPRDARKAFEKGLQLIRKGKTEEAEKEYRKAVTAYPRYADAWNELGRIQLDRGQDDVARETFQTAIQADPKYVNPYLQLSIIYMRHAQWRDLADDTAVALKLDAFDYPQAWLFNGVANWNLKNTAAAEKSIREAERLDSRHTLPQVYHLMGMILAQRHDYNGAAEYLRLYLRLDPAAEDVDKARVQLALAEKQLAENGTAVKQE